MLPKSNAAALSFNPRSIIGRGLILLLTLSLLTGSLRAQGDAESRRMAAEKLFNEGVQLRDESSKESRQEAIRKFKDAHSLFQAINDRSRQGSTLLNVGFIYNALGEQEKALEYYAQALTLFRAAEDRSGEAITLNNMGEIYFVLGQKLVALDYANKALVLFRAIGDRGGEGTTLVGIGVIYYFSGENTKAVGYFGQASELFLAIGDPLGLANTLNQLGLLLADSGQSQEALDSHLHALRLYDEIDAIDVSGSHAFGYVEGKVATLQYIGAVYRTLGAKEKALEYLNRALLLNRSGGDRRGENHTLVRICGLHDDFDERQKAIDCYEQVLPGARTIGDPQTEADVLIGLGTIYRNSAAKQKALEYFSQALRLRRGLGDHRGEGIALNLLGAVYHDLGENEKASEHCEQALTLFRAAEYRYGEIDALGIISLIERSLGNWAEAHARLVAAIAIIESLRMQIMNQELRSTYFAKVQYFYELDVDTLMRWHRVRPSDGHNAEALGVSERARARSLLETLAEANADIRQGVDAALVERERDLQRRLNATAQLQMSLLSRAHTKEQAAAFAGEIEALTTEYQQVETQIRQKSPRYAALTQPQPLSLKEIQTQVLDADTVVLEYSLGEERSYLWAVTPNSMTSYELPKRDEIEGAARRFYELLNARNTRVKGETKEQWKARVVQADKDTPAAAADLSRMVLTPVAAELGKKRLVIVADGVLQYIPFASLPAPDARRVSASGKPATYRPSTPVNYQPLIAEHEIVNLPSASTLSVLRREVSGRPKAPKTVVALADPVFAKNDARIKRVLDKPTDGKETGTDKDADRSESVKELQLLEAIQNTGVSGDGLYVPRLPGTRQEAEEIIAMVPAAERKLVLDFAASRETASSAELSQYRYVHFSTHGFLNSVHPELSGLVFSLVNERGEAQDGFLRAHEVFNLKLPADLIVLSACQTGIGKEVKGEGLVSLTRGFMYAGSPRVVVSLWSVSEMGTTELMVRFYRSMLKEGKPPAAALRAAQLSLMKEKRWASPYYWAPFVLQGEWR